MILVDTSVWVDHLRANSKALAGLLNGGSVLIHPFIIGEIALGYLRRRQTVLNDLSSLPRVTVATDAEVLRYIDTHALAGRGIGYVDAHLLAATQLSAGTEFWTTDKRLRAVATQLGLASKLS